MNQTTSGLLFPPLVVACKLGENLVAIEYLLKNGANTVYYDSTKQDYFNLMRDTELYYKFLTKLWLTYRKLTPEGIARYEYILNRF